MSAMEVTLSIEEARALYRIFLQMDQSRAEKLSRLVQRSQDTVQIKLLPVTMIHILGATEGNLRSTLLSTLKSNGFRFDGFRWTTRPYIGHTKEVIVSALGVSVEEFDYDDTEEQVIHESQQNYEMDLGYVPGILLGEKADEYFIRNYTIPNAKENSKLAERRIAEILRDLTEFGVTIGYVTGDTSFTVISIRDNGVAREWGDIRTFQVRMGIKVMKRLAMLGTFTYLYDELPVYILGEGEAFEFDPNILTAKFVEVPEDAEILIDGNNVIRRARVLDVIDKMYTRVSRYDRKRAEELKKQFLDTWAFNMRGIFGEHFAKGDAVVSEAEQDADLIIFTTNTPKELVGLREGMARFHLNPQEQSESVRTNPQTIASFYQVLFNVVDPTWTEDEPKLNMVKLGKHRKTNHQIEELESGRVMRSVLLGGGRDGDALDTMEGKLLHWEASGLRVGDSMHLTAMMAGRVDKQNNPPGNPIKKRKFDVPYAYRMSIRSSTTYELVYGHAPDMIPGEVLIDRIGLIIHDEDWSDVIETLGGADQDDHAEIHFRVAVDDDEFFGIKAGDIVGYLIRNPIGISSDGVAMVNGVVVNKHGDPARIATEFYILKIAARSLGALQVKLGALPTVKNALRPLSTIELKDTLPEDTFIPTKPDYSNDPVYTKKHFVAAIKAASKVHGVYGTHALLMQTYALYQLPFIHRAAEEAYVDTAQQSRVAEDLKLMDGFNQDDREDLISRLSTIDPLLAARIGVKSENVPFKAHHFTKLVEFHAAEGDRFYNAARIHLRNIKHAQEARFDGVDVPLVHGKAEIVTNLRMMTKRYRDEMGIDGDLSFEDFEEIGTRTARRLLEIRSFSTVLQMLRDGHVWLAQNVEASNNRHDRPFLSSLYTNTDSRLMAGELFPLLVKALTYGPHPEEVA